MVSDARLPMMQPEAMERFNPMSAIVRFVLKSYFWYYRIVYCIDVGQGILKAKTEIMVVEWERR